MADKKQKKKKVEHIHSLERIKGSKRLYKCMDADCFWTSDVYRLVGKKFLCSYCPTVFKLTDEGARLKRPHCPNCSPPTNFKNRTIKIPEKPAIVVDTEDIVDILERIPEL